MKEPRNATYVAAELAASAPKMSTPYGCAKLATELCSLGERYVRLSERLCNGYQDARGRWDEKATERAEKRRDRIVAQCKDLLQPWRGRARLADDGSLYLVLVTKRHGIEYRTALCTRF